MPRMYDGISLEDKDAKVRFTKDGYLVATPRIARTGIQLYRGSECGIVARATRRSPKYSATGTLLTTATIARSFSPPKVPRSRVCKACPTCWCCSAMPPPAARR
jgi:Uncharacterized protein conserved in bacteria (DUF2213)